MEKQRSFWYFSKREKIDLIVSWLTLSLAFAVVLMNIDFVGSMAGIGSAISLSLAIPIALLSVGTGFVFHELAHRQAARHYGFVSEYRAWYPLLGFAVIFAFLTGWILAAPGATYFFAREVTRKQNGIISVAGPMTNIIIGLVLILFLPLAADGFMQTLLVAASRINFFFAFFNLLPIFLLDGKKVLAWNPKVWLAAIIIPTIASFFPQLIYGFFI